MAEERVSEQPMPAEQVTELQPAAEEAPGPCHWLEPLKPGVPYTEAEVQHLAREQCSWTEGADPSSPEHGQPALLQQALELGTLHSALLPAGGPEERELRCYWRPWEAAVPAVDPAPSRTAAPAAGKRVPPLTTPRVTSVLQTPLAANSKRRRISTFRSPLLTLTPGAGVPQSSKREPGPCPPTPSTPRPATGLPTPRRSTPEAHAACVPGLAALRTRLAASTREWETRLRTLDVVLRHHATQEEAKLDALITKWRDAARQALEHLRTSLGPVLVSAIYYRPHAASSFCGEEDAWGGAAPPTVALQVQGDDDAGAAATTTTLPPSVDPYETRLMTFKEMCDNLKLDIGLLGSYDGENDCFYD